MGTVSFTLLQRYIVKRFFDCCKGHRVYPKFLQLVTIGVRQMKQSSLNKCALLRRRYTQASSGLIFLNISKELHLFYSFCLTKKNQKVKKNQSFHPQSPPHGPLIFQASASLISIKKL
jgi:hypothetical protein